MADITKKVVVRFPPEIHAALKIAAVGDDPPSSFNSLVLYACRRFLASLDAPVIASSAASRIYEVANDPSFPSSAAGSLAVGAPAEPEFHGQSPRKVRTFPKGVRTPADFAPAASPIPAGRREVVTHWKGGKS